MKVSTGYTLLCLVVPLVWGLISSRLFDVWQARRTPRLTDCEPPDKPESGEMYHI